MVHDSFQMSSTEIIFLCCIVQSRRLKNLSRCWWTIILNLLTVSRAFCWIVFNRPLLYVATKTSSMDYSRPEFKAHTMYQLVKVFARQILSYDSDITGNQTLYRQHICLIKKSKGLTRIITVTYGPFLNDIHRYWYFRRNWYLFFWHFLDYSSLR